MRMMRTLAGLAAAVMVAFTGAEARAEFPDQPITMIIGFAAGGGTDLAGRALATELQDILGQPVVVVNMPGAASMVAAGEVANARADGYTIWFGSAGTLITRQALGQAPADYGDGLRLAGLTGTLVAALGVPVDSPFQSVQDIIDAANANPGDLRWSHNGVGAAFMAMGQGFISGNDLNVVGVPFQGARGLREALTSNSTDFGVLNAGDRLRLGEDNFRLLAAIASSREQVLDDTLPTLAELGIDFVEIPSPVGVLLPAGVSDDIVMRLDAAIEEATGRESFAETMRNIYIPVTYQGMDSGDAYIRQLQDNVEALLPTLRN